MRYIQRMHIDSPPLRPVLSLETSGQAALGAEKVRLLEAVGRAGSISAAARTLGISYKHAWDGIAALNNLAGRPLVAGRKGGARGGGATLTPAGARFVEAFRRLEAETAERLRRIEAELGDEGPAARRVVAGVLRTSARNALAGTITKIAEGPVSCLVTLDLAPGMPLSAVITRSSLVDLGLFPGRAAVALIKAPFIRLAPPDTPGNGLATRVIRIDPEGEVTEVTLDIGGGRTLVAVGPRAALPSPGTACRAVIDPGHVILAVD